MEQRSQEWIEERLGKITGSRMKDVILPRLSKGANKGERSEAAIKYMIQLAGERITGMPTEFFVSRPMQNGIDREPDAIALYQYSRCVITESVGFVQHPSIPFFGASPDFLVGDYGGGEVKCPELHTFLKWKLSGQVPEDHLPQMHSGMACTGRKWWDFVAYHPDMPHGLNLMIVRVNRDDELIKQYESSVMEFELELREMVQKIRG